VARVEALLYQKRGQPAADRSPWQLSRVHTEFVRPAPRPHGGEQTRRARLNTEISSSDAFKTNVIKRPPPMARWRVEHPPDLDGRRLADRRRGAQAAGETRGPHRQWLTHPADPQTSRLLERLTNRALRERIYKPRSPGRGRGDTDNTAVIAQWFKLARRACRAAG